MEIYGDVILYVWIPCKCSDQTLCEPPQLNPTSIPTGPQLKTERLINRCTLWNFRSLRKVLRLKYSHLSVVFIMLRSGSLTWVYNGKGASFFILEQKKNGQGKKNQWNNGLTCEEYVFFQDLMCISDKWDINHSFVTLIYINAPHLL